LTTKLALTNDEIQKFLVAAKEYSEFCWQTAMIILKTGMHVSVICKHEKYNVRVDDIHISWNRPKKKGHLAFTQIKLSNEIKPFVKEYFSKRIDMTRQNLYIMFNIVGKNAGLDELKISPMTFRHCAGCSLLDLGVPSEYVCQILNCSSQTLRRSYSRLKQPKIDATLERINW